jgi:hypothetical protein
MMQPKSRIATAPRLLHSMQREREEARLVASRKMQRRLTALLLLCCALALSMLALAYLAGSWR